MGSKKLIIVKDDKSRVETVSISQELMAAPVAYVVLNADLIIVALNDMAKKQKFETGRSITDYFHELDSRLFYEKLNSGEATAFEGRLNTQKTFELNLAPLTDNPYVGLWLRDTSELKYIQSQLQSLRKPERKLLHQINNLISATLGYSDLVELMLEEKSVLTPERISAISRYQNEMSAGLEQAERLLQRQQHGPATVEEPGMSNRHILVVQQKATRSELMVELLRSQRFKVTSFIDSSAAMEFVKINSNALDLAIVGRVDELTDLLLVSDSKIEIIVCGSDDVDLKENRLHPVPDNPLDINELLTTVLELFDS